MWIVYGIQFETVTVTKPLSRKGVYKCIVVEVQGQFQELHHVHAFPQIEMKITTVRNHQPVSMY